MQTAPKLKVAIVGSGLAGLSTAVELLDQGYEVDIYEQRPFIGGKVASYRDKDGNHVEMGYEHRLQQLIWQLPLFHYLIPALHSWTSPHALTLPHIGIEVVQQSYSQHSLTYLACMCLL